MPHPGKASAFACGAAAIVIVYCTPFITFTSLLGHVSQISALQWCIVFSVYMYQIAIAKQQAACLKSNSLITMLEFVPYQLRAADCATIVPTVNPLFNAEVSFFETDDTRRTTNSFSLKISEDNSVITGTVRSCFQSAYIYYDTAHNIRSVDPP